MYHVCKDILFLLLKVFFVEKYNYLTSIFLFSTPSTVIAKPFPVIAKPFPVISRYDEISQLSCHNGTLSKRQSTRLYHGQVLSVIAFSSFRICNPELSKARICNPNMFKGRIINTNFQKQRIANPLRQLAVTMLFLRKNAVFNIHNINDIYNFVIGSEVRQSHKCQAVTRDCHV